MGWVEYDALPKTARLALAAYLSNESGREVDLGGRAWQDHADGYEYRLESIPVAEMQQRVMIGDLATDFPNFNAYHNWYLSLGDVPDHDTSRWPVLRFENDLDNEYLEDGWHRFHSYVRAGDREIPLLIARVKEERHGH